MKKNLILIVENDYDLIEEQVFLSQKYIKSKKCFVIYTQNEEATNSEDIIFFAIRGKKMLRFKLKGKLEDIKKNHREEILTYRLGDNFDKNEVVGLGDIFMQGEHIELIK